MSQWHPNFFAHCITGAVPLATLARHALVNFEEKVRLVDIDEGVAEPIGVHGSRIGILRWSGEPTACESIWVPAGGLRARAAMIRATAMAGAGDRLLDLTTAHASERVQFGKLIGRQHASQQQLAVVAEHAIAARYRNRDGAITRNGRHAVDSVDLGGRQAGAASGGES